MSTRTVWKAAEANIIKDALLDRDVQKSDKDLAKRLKEECVELSRFSELQIEQKIKYEKKKATKRAKLNEQALATLFVVSTFFLFVLVTGI